MNSSNKAQELIDFDLKQGGLDYKLDPSAQHQDLSWLKEMKKPLSKKRKVQRSKFKSRLVTSRCTAKYFLQNHQMGKVSKKDWESDIIYIRKNIFPFLTVWLNPTRIDTKHSSYSHPYTTSWIYFM